MSPVQVVKDLNSGDSRPGLTIRRSAA
jgi:hypothetical protein